MPHREAQISNSVRSFCSTTWSSFDFICRYNKQSSAKSLTWDRTTSGSSLTEIFGLWLIPAALELQYCGSRAATTCGSRAALKYFVCKLVFPL